MSGPRAAQSSPLLALPAEIRLRIYSWLMRGYGYYPHNRAMTRMTITPKYRHGFPHPMMHVCSALRLEFTPEFYKNLEVQITRRCCDAQERDRLSDVLLSWVRDVVGPWAQHLVVFSVVDVIGIVPYAMQIYRRNGRLETYGFFNHDTNEMLETDLPTMVQTIEAECRDRGAQGADLFVQVVAEYVKQSDPESQYEELFWGEDGLVWLEDRSDDSD